MLSPPNNARRSLGHVAHRQGRPLERDRWRKFRFRLLTTLAIAVGAMREPVFFPWVSPGCSLQKVHRPDPRDPIFLFSGGRIDLGLCIQESQSLPTEVGRQVNRGTSPCAPLEPQTISVHDPGCSGWIRRVLPSDREVVNTTKTSSQRKLKRRKYHLFKHFVGGAIAQSSPTAPALVHKGTPGVHRPSFFHSPSARH